MSDGTWGYSEDQSHVQTQERSMYSDGDPFTSESGAIRDHESPDAQSPSPASPRRDGAHWYWSAEHKDYIQWRGDELLLYREYQRSGYNPDIKSVPSSRPSRAEDFRRPGPSSSLTALSQFSHEQNPGWSGLDHRSADLDSEARFQGLQPSPNASHGVPMAPAAPSGGFGQPMPLKSFAAPLDPRFRIVDKPKRFFSVGRIFKTVWFEPGGHDIGIKRTDLEYMQEAREFHGEKPHAKFRWFVVVRKRLHHSLCFSITSYAAKGTTQSSRGRAKDFVVLFSCAIEPPAPFPDEGIERPPIAVIIEDGEQFISPLARLDCGRIYTVEDNLKVMKIGRVQPDSLPNLENYFKESVE